jgi:hypothetical protein
MTAYHTSSPSRIAICLIFGLPAPFPSLNAEALFIGILRCHHKSHDRSSVLFPEKGPKISHSPTICPELSPFTKFPKPSPSHTRIQNGRVHADYPRPRDSDLIQPIIPISVIYPQPLSQPLPRSSVPPHARAHAHTSI